MKLTDEEEEKIIDMIINYASQSCFDGNIFPIIDVINDIIAEKIRFQSKDK